MDYYYQSPFHSVYYSISMRFTCDVRLLHQNKYYITLHVSQTGSALGTQNVLVLITSAYR